MFLLLLWQEEVLSFELLARVNRKGGGRFHSHLFCRFCIGQVTRWVCSCASLSTCIFCWTAELIWKNLKRSFSRLLTDRFDTLISKAFVLSSIHFFSPLMQLATFLFSSILNLSHLRNSRESYNWILPSHCVVLTFALHCVGAIQRSAFPINFIYFCYTTSQVFLSVNFLSWKENVLSHLQYRRRRNYQRMPKVDLGKNSLPNYANYFRAKNQGLLRKWERCIMRWELIPFSKGLFSPGINFTRKVLPRFKSFHMKVPLSEEWEEKGRTRFFFGRMFRFESFCSPQGNFFNDVLWAIVFVY